MSRNCKQKITKHIFYNFVFQSFSAAAVAKYCNEYVSVCVCLSKTRYGEPTLYLLNL